MVSLSLSAAVTTVTFTEKDETTVVMSDLFPSKEALDATVAGQHERTAGAVRTTVRDSNRVRV